MADEVGDPLHASTFFGGLGTSIRRELAAAGEALRLEAGGVLWSSGEVARSVALVLAGRLKALRERGRREVLLDIALPGDVLGDVAFVTCEPHQETITAFRRSRVLTVPGQLLREALAREPRAYLSALVSMARRVQRQSHLVESLASGQVSHRVAAVLLDLAQRAGAPFPGGHLVPIRLPRADLAALAATSPESVSRQLGAWQRRGLLTLLPNGYLLRDLSALASLAGPPPR